MKKVNERGEPLKGRGLSGRRVVVVVVDQFIYPAIYWPEWIMAAVGFSSTYMT